MTKTLFLTGRPSPLPTHLAPTSNHMWRKIARKFKKTNEKTPSTRTVKQLSASSNSRRICSGPLPCSPVWPFVKCLSLRGWAGWIFSMTLFHRLFIIPSVTWANRPINVVRHQSSGRTINTQNWAYSVRKLRWLMQYSTLASFYRARLTRIAAPIAFTRPAPCLKRSEKMETTRGISPLIALHSLMI